MILRSLLERGRTWSLRRKMEERRARERGGVERWDLFPSQACWSADATVTYKPYSPWPRLEAYFSNSMWDQRGRDDLSLSAVHTGCSDVLVSSECAGLQSCKCKWMHLRVSFTWWCFRWIPSLPNRYLGQKTDEGTFINVNNSSCIYSTLACCGLNLNYQLWLRAETCSIWLK